MPALNFSSPLDSSIDQLSQKIRRIRERSGEPADAVDSAMDSAMNVVERNIGRQEARDAEVSLSGLGSLGENELSIHMLDPDKVASLIADPFDD